MSAFPHMFLFSSTLMMGTMVSLSGPSWLTVWIGMELNLLSFLPLLSSKSSAESAIKYFLIQVWGGVIFLLFMSMYHVTSFVFFMVIAALGVMMKSGMPPCHNWFPTMMNSISWMMCLVLSTWQKLTPLFILFWFLLPNVPLLVVVSMSLISAYIGTFGGINQTMVRPLLAYSSITHMGWMLMVAPFSSMFASLYLFTYFIMIFPLMIIFMMSSTSKIFYGMSKINLIWAFLLILSLGGFPPFSGFMLKVMVLCELVSGNLMVPSIFLLITTLINLSFYLNLGFNSLMSNSSNFMGNVGFRVNLVSYLSLFSLWVGSFLFIF